MPKVVDHEARRAELGEAVWRVALRRGLEEATLREIAAEAGWSTGALAHYFADKDELLRFAFRLVVRRTGARFARAVEGGDRLEALGAALRESLPLDEERRAEARVWLAFLGRSLSRPELAAERRGFYAGWRRGVADAIAAGRSDGTLRTDLPPETEAAGLIALVDGLALQALSDPAGLPPARQTAILDAALARLRAPSRTHVK
jgi:TetR/AcrR family transcriptional regulator, transcriptional repressor of bet genes